jgi:hypothetical protein
MRKLVLLLAILALPGLAFGDPEHLDVGIGGLPGGVISMPPAVNPITIDVLLTSAIAIDGAQYSLYTDLNGMGPGSGDHLVTYDALTPWINGVLFMGLGIDYQMHIGTGAGAGMTMAAINMQAPEMYFKNYGSVPPVVAGLLAQYVIHVAPLNPGDTLAIYAGADPMGMFGNGYITYGGAGGGPWHQGAPLIITPEPATMLLLLGALPFLRRRR